MGVVIDHMDGPALAAVAAIAAIATVAADAAVPGLLPAGVVAAVPAVPAAAAEAAVSAGAALHRDHEALGGAGLDEVVGRRGPGIIAVQPGDPDDHHEPMPAGGDHAHSDLHLRAV
ncbi:MAG: hypothetical protein ABIK09_15030 [Pseudomonadota bacterium]